ncbi:hypothetical protein Dda_2395 [Drechslerella dactyloides]|uniref:Uncharacterized protein n=1 Tax=Drechslerella dactyloides TaxID=74499 RepID=A0AAD6J3M6_DREDA|nr:hypothetical protein Dda_2395 [Drechslerella dactyloides]
MPRRKKHYHAHAYASKPKKWSPELISKAIGTNPQNVKLTAFDIFKCRGRDPQTLVGKHIIKSTPWHSYPMVLTLREEPKAIHINGTVTGRFFTIETCDSLKTHLAKASPKTPLKIIAAAWGQKQVAYTAPRCPEKRELYGKKQVDLFNLVGLQLEGMQEIGWIWSEDMINSFEEGQLKASVFIGYQYVARKHTPLEARELGEISEEDISEKPEGEISEDWREKGEVEISESSDEIEEGEISESPNEKEEGEISEDSDEKEEGEILEGSYGLSGRKPNGVYCKTVNGAHRNESKQPHGVANGFANGIGIAHVTDSRRLTEFLQRMETEIDSDLTDLGSSFDEMDLDPFV